MSLIVFYSVSVKEIPEAFLPLIVGSIYTRECSGPWLDWSNMGQVVFRSTKYSLKNFPGKCLDSVTSVHRLRDVSGSEEMHLKIRHFCNRPSLFCCCRRGNRKCYCFLI